MSWVGIILWALVVAIAVSPPRWDPAIRLKEYNRTGSWRWPYDK